MNRLSHTTYWKSPVSILDSLAIEPMLRGDNYRKMAKSFANNGEPDQMLYSASSDLGLHCLPITLLGVSRLQGVEGTRYTCTAPDKVFFQPKKTHIFLTSP